MSKVLFIRRDDIVRNSVLSGNVDSDKFLQFIEIAQEIHIQNYLGTKLSVSYTHLTLPTNREV